MAGASRGDTRANVTTAATSTTVASLHTLGCHLRPNRKTLYRQSHVAERPACAVRPLRSSPTKNPALIPDLAPAPGLCRFRPPSIDYQLKRGRRTLAGNIDTKAATPLFTKDLICGRSSPRPSSRWTASCRRRADRRRTRRAGSSTADGRLTSWTTRWARPSTSF